MKRMDTFLKENLNGYNLPADSLIELRSVLVRRYRKKFSQGLSPEGRQAMKDVAEQDGILTDKTQSRPVSFKQHVNEQQGKRTRKISFTNTDKISTHKNSNLDGNNVNGLHQVQKKDRLVVTYTETPGDKRIEKPSDLSRVTDDTVKQIALDKCMTWIQEQTGDV